MPKATPKNLYTVTAKFNDTETTVKGDDLDTLLLQLAPEQLHTEMYITVAKGEESTERRLPLVRGRMLFTDDLTREIFINNLTYSFT